MAESFDDGIDDLLVDDERGSDQYVIAIAPVHGASHRINEQARRHRFALDERVQSEVGRKRSLAGPVRDELDSPEESTTPDIPDEGMIAQTLAQSRLHPLALASHVLEPAITTDDLLNSECARASERMTEKGLPVPERSRAAPQAIGNLRSNEQCGEWHVASAQALGKSNQVRRDALLLARVQRARPAHAAHHFIENQQHSVAVTNCPNLLEVARHGRNGPKRSADHCLGYERGDVLGPLPQNLRFELFGEALRI